MPRRELRHPHQVENWLIELGNRVSGDGKDHSMILIGSAALLWHAHQKGVVEGFEDSSMDVDPITSDEAVAFECYEAQIGSEFELKNGWHVNIMPSLVLHEFKEDWITRSSKKMYDHLTVQVPSPADLLFPKLKRGEPRDLRHEQYSKRVGLL